MRLAYLVAYDPWTSRTGTEVGARNIAAGMAARGHDVTVFHAYGSGGRTGGAGEPRVIGTHQTEIPLVSGWSANRAIRRIVQDAGPDTFDVLDLFGSGLGPAFSRLEGSRATRVFHVIDLALPEWSSLGSGKLRSLPLYLGLAVGERRAVRAADVLIAISHGTQENLEARYPESRDKTRVIRLPIPDAWFGPGRIQNPEHFLYIAAGVRRWTEVFLHALAHLKEGGTPAKGVILREPRRELRRLADRLEVDVEFLDDVPEGPPMMDLYARSYAFVLPSSREGMCLPVVEAASQGTPSISSPLPSVQDFVEAGVDGIFVASSDPRAWAEPMRRLLTDDALRTRLGARARERSETYRVSKVVTELEAVYSKGAP